MDKRHACSTCGIVLATRPKQQSLSEWLSDLTRCPACHDGLIGPVDKLPVFCEQVDCTALHSRVLIAAHTRVEGTWKAYCEPVPGICHQSELHQVLRTGAPLPERYARAMFPRWNDLPYAR